MIDITKIFKKYQNKWIAFTDDDEIICVGKTLDNVMQEAKKRGYSEPVTMKIPNSRFEFVMYAQPN